MKKLSKIINHKIGDKTLCCIASKCGVGKTSLQLILAAEAVLEGKNVLFLSDNHPKYVMEEFAKLIDPNTKWLGRLNVTLSNGNMKTELDWHLKSEKFDYLFIDDVNYDNEIHIRYLKTLDLSVFINHQLINTMNSSRSPKSTKFLNIVDSVLVIDKKDKFTFLENLKYMFMFWKAKPNRVIKYLKNRNGENLETLISLNFETLTINK